MKNNRFQKLINQIGSLFEKMDKDHISESSAQCAYYTILSFIPFIILLLTLIQYTNIEQEALFDMISKIIPSSMNEIILGIIREVYSKSIGTISISLIFTLWSADKGLFALIKGLNTVFETNSKKNNSIIYLKLTSILKTAIFIILIVVGLVVLVFGNSILSIIQEHFNGFKNYTIISGLLTEMIFIFLTFVVFMVIYKFLPKHKIKLKQILPGSIFGALGLNIISYVFSKYLFIFKGFSITYGSLTTLMLIMMWTYTCFYIIFLGAEINVFLEQRSKVVN